jgi:hypothetical protein
MRALRTHFFALLALALLDGCVAMGWRFGPGLSSSNAALFAEPPVIEHRGDEYFLSWTYGTAPFFFRPNYQPMDGRLVFALVATSSSGHLAGRKTELKIEGAENLEALKSGGAFWWEPDPEPDGKFVPLKIE